MSCPVCLNPVTAPALVGTDFLFESTSKTFTLYSCEACRCLFLHPMPDRGEIERFYPADYWWNARRSGGLKKLESVYRKLALRDHVAFITKAAGNRSVDVLDVGCGSGTLLGLLKHRGFRVTGLDFSAEAAAIAKAEKGVDVAVGSLEEAHFPAESFDVVTLFHVMEHVTNPRLVLAEVSRVLKPNGVAILQVPNIESWHFNLRDNCPALVSSVFPSLDPVSRSVRHRKRNNDESRPVEWFRHLTYLLLVTCAYPVVLLESAFGCGATIMIEAKKK